MKPKPKRRPAQEADTPRRDSRPPGKRTANKDRTRKAILEAALDLFSRQGFYATTTKQISRKAGIAEGTLFNYFRTKEDLALYFLEREVDALISWFGHDNRLQGAPLPEQLFAVIHRLFERIEPYQEFIGAISLRGLHPGSKLSPFSIESGQINLRYLRFLREILEASEARSEIPRVGEIGAYAIALFHVAMVAHWLNDESPGKEKTLAVLDRCLKLGTTMLKKGGWDW